MFGSSHGTKKLVALADVGSASVAVAVIETHPAGPAQVIAAHRVFLPFEPRSDSSAIAAIVAGLKDAGEKVLASLSQNSHKNIRIGHAYAVMHAPWTRSKTVNATVVFPKEERITTVMINKQAQEAIAADKEFDRNHLVESTAVRVELNGYPTSTPIGKSAHRLSVSVLLSEGVADIRSGVATGLQALFPNAAVVERSGARTLIGAMSSIDQLQSDYVIVSVMAEATSVIVVRNGLAEQYALIPEGVRTIIKRVSEKGMQEETLSLLRMIERDECNNDACEAIATSMARVEIELARVYGENLTKLATPVRLPPDMVLVTHEDVRPWLTKFFSRIDFTQCTSTTQPFSVHALSQQDLKSSISAGEPEPNDIELSIAAALVNNEERA